jgi:CheY-specific phosphatase CheX
MDGQLSSETSIEQLKDKIKLLVRHAAEDRVRKHSNQGNFNLVDVERYKAGQVMGNWMSLILITGSPLKITLKLHFSHKHIKKLIFPLYRLESPEGISDQQSMDFIKELCNLTAGYIEQAFEQKNISLGISLPLGIPGFYEIFADYTPSTSPILKYDDLWSLKFGDMEILGTVLIEVNDINALENFASYDIVEDEDSDEGEFDFL